MSRLLRRPDSRLVAVHGHPHDGRLTRTLRNRSRAGDWLIFPGEFARGASFYQKVIQRGSRENVPVPLPWPVNGYLAFTP